MIDTKPRNILIVRLSAIGDVIHALPCLHALREAFPNAHIGWLVEELSAPLLQGHPELDELFVIPKKRWRAHPVRTFFNGEQPAMIRRLRRTRWDVAVDLQGLTKSGVPLRLSGARLRIGYGDEDGRELNKIFTNRRVVPPPEARHVVERNLALLAELGIHVPSDNIHCRFPDFSAERQALSPFVESLGRPRYIALYPGAGWETKKWPPAHFASLARLLSDPARAPKAAELPKILIWGPGEESLCREIIDNAHLPAENLTTAPPTNLRELAALLQKAAVVVGGDTGPVHLAAALQVPVVGIYGGSDPVRNGPWGSGNRRLLSTTAPCTVCWRTRCDQPERILCLHSIVPETVARAVEEYL